MFTEECKVVDVPGKHEAVHACVFKEVKTYVILMYVNLTTDYVKL